MSYQFNTDKPVAAVRFEGTVADWDTRIAREGALDRLASLRETHYVVIVSALAHDYLNTSLLLEWLARHGSPYDEVWMDSGLPAADRWIDDCAEKLCATPEATNPQTT